MKLNNNKLVCNTYYLEYETKLKEEENVLFLSSLSKLLYDNDVDTNIHVIMKNDDYQIIATIVDYKVSYTISIIKKE